ncbi:MAG: DNA mismatch repair protein MutS [Candidatus Woesearchaeota archaeon]
MENNETLSVSTPAMKQWKQIKEKYPDHLILFRMGDFYEMFYDDAKEGSKILGIALTKRGTTEKVPLAGIPVKSLEMYMKKLVESNKKIVIVEQLEDPKTAKGVVKRGVFKEITPGTISFSDLLNEQENNYLAIIHYNERFFLLLADISTRDLLYFHSASFEDILVKLLLYKPKEILLDKNFNLDVFQDHKDEFYFTFLDFSEFDKVEQEITFSDDYSQQLLETFAVLYNYVKKTQLVDNVYFKSPQSLSNEKYMYLDDITIYNLDLIRNSYTNSEKGSLLEAINGCVTSFGNRLLRRIIVQPLIDIKEINKRHNLVEYLTNNVVILESIRSILKEFFDLERIVGRINNNTAKAQDLIQLKYSLNKYKELFSYLENIKVYIDFEDPKFLEELIDFLEKSINDDYTLDYIIKPGYNEELDELRNIKNSAEEYIKNIEALEKERTGIVNLKVKYNSVFGFFIEVPKGQIDKVPKNYIRKQTLVNAERYITPELKDFEIKYLSAEERIKELEEFLFKEIVDKSKTYSSLILSISDKLAYLDVLSGFATIALNYNYVRPVFQSNDIIILEGRHPVVERTTNFVSNDTYLEDKQIHIITGPNMSGKSTYLRQVAIIQLLAQIGSFVPAKYAKLCLVDAIFTRIGARDNVAYGESTFMVEMKETGNILNKATKNSLIILDEVGRGTSTYDGISLAWSIIEYILFKIQAKTLFATHYHVLTHMEELYHNVKNYHTLIEESENGIIFKRKIVEGGLDKSYGIEVAKLAKLPQYVIDRAYLLQKAFEKYDNMKDNVIRALYSVYEEDRKKITKEEKKKEDVEKNKKLDDWFKNNH